jgi:hypothetical protein
LRKALKFVQQRAKTHDSAPDIFQRVSRLFRLLDFPFQKVDRAADNVQLVGKFMSKFGHSDS